MSISAVVFLLTAIFNFAIRHRIQGHTLNAQSFVIFVDEFMPLYYIAVCFMVGMGLFTIFLSLAMLTERGE